MFISSESEKEVGKVYRNVYLNDQNGNPRICTFLLIREATREEFLGYCRELDVHFPRMTGFYYEISMD